MFRSLHNDAQYRLARTQRDVEGNVIRHNGRSRHQQAALKSSQGRAAQISSWIEYEYATQQLLWSMGTDVPQPLAQMGNAVLMEYIGALGAPAPLLRAVRLTREEAQPLFEAVLNNIERFLTYNRIHGDLSEYNMLYWQGQVKIIDFAQAVDPRQDGGVFPLLLRDIERVCSYFIRYGINTEPHALAHTIWERCTGGSYDYA